MRQRSLNVVFDEIEYLYQRGLRNYWLICSELNIGNARLARALARRFIEFAKTKELPVTWRAYHLPKWLNAEDLSLLYQSGFQGGWNDFPSFDDDNLKASRVPYRSKDALAHLATTIKLHPGAIDGIPPHFSLFLGNAYATPSVVRRSLEVYDRLGFGDHFESGLIGSATRLFQPFGSDKGIPGKSDAWSLSREGRLAMSNPVHPRAGPAAGAGDEVEEVGRSGRLGASVHFIFFGGPQLMKLPPHRANR